MAPKSRSLSVNREIDFKPYTGSPRSHILPHTKEAGDPYFIGDIYDRISSGIQYSIRETTASEKCPYQAYIQRLSLRWPYMQYLADFMDVTCAPPKRRMLEENDRLERASRMRVSMLDFSEDGKIRRTNFEMLSDLQNALNNGNYDHDKVHRRLFVVEDLSRDVIEAFGGRFDIDPRFFRGHISDYLWYNTRDPWVELPDLEVLAAKRDFFHIRYFQPRYFLGDEGLRAKREAGGFNVLRRIDIEADRVMRLDEPACTVGMVRSKASFWIRPNKDTETGALGIVLVDPPITTGFPLWAGYNHFGEFHGMNAEDSFPVPQEPTIPIFENYIYWTEHMTRAEQLCIEKDPRAFIRAALIIICSHWKIVLEFAGTRLTQIEWEVEDASIRSHPRSEGLESCLKRLQRWKRVLPIYRGMVNDTLSNIFKRRHSHFGSSQLSELHPDFDKLLEQISGLQNRAERIGSLVANMISIEEAKKGVQQNENLTRLTYLACIFIPLQFVSSLFSMTNSLESLKETFWIYFSIAIPLTMICLLITLLVYSDRSLFSRLWHSAGRTRN